MYHNKLFGWGLLIVFIAGAVAGLLYQLQGMQFTTAAKATSQAFPYNDVSVVGKPSLPAATVDAIFKDLGSPMSGTGQEVEQASEQTNIDDAFALAVWWIETNDGAAGVGLADRNPGSVRGSVGYPSAFDGYTIYPSYSAAIVYWFNMLKNMYVNRGLNTVYLISHPYVGTASSPLWAGKVVAFMLTYRGEAPPVPIIVPHGKKVTEPAVYIHIIPVSPLQMQQAQRRIDKTKKDGASFIERKVTTATPISTTTYVVVIFALLLALAIVAGVFFLEKRAGRKRAPDRSSDATKRMESAQNRQLHDTVIQSEHFHIRGKLLLPSTSPIDPAKSGELTSTGSQRGRSTGLLSRYSETYHD